MRQKFELGTAAVGFATALITALVAFHTVGNANDKTEDANNKAQTAQSRVVDSQTQISELRQQNQDLTRQLSEAEASLAAVPTPSADSDDQAPALPDGVSVRRSTGKKPIRLSPNYGVDLDDDLSGNWGVGDGPLGSSAGYGLDINLDPTYGKIGILGSSAQVNGPVDYNTCATETAYSNDSLNIAKAKKGTQVCLQTSEKRYALITIVSASLSGLTFTATVWDPPFE